MHLAGVRELKKLFHW